jgi:hypothetical protein
MRMLNPSSTITLGAAKAQCRISCVIDCTTNVLGATVI